MNAQIKTEQIITGAQNLGTITNRLNNGDCAVVLGRDWAEQNGFTTFEELEKPASAEHAAEARRVLAERKKNGTW